jgi:hypothetical protein
MSRACLLAASLLAAPLTGCSVHGRVVVGPSLDTHRGVGVQGLLAVGFTAYDPHGFAPEATVEVGGGTSTGPVHRTFFVFPALDLATTPSGDEGWVLRGGPRLGARVFFADTAGAATSLGKFALGGALLGGRRFGKGGTFHEIGLDVRCFGTFGAAPYGGAVCALSPAYTLTARGWKGPTFGF